MKPKPKKKHMEGTRIQNVLILKLRHLRKRTDKKKQTRE